MTHTTANYDERWVRGFSYEFDSQPEVQLFTVNDVDTGNAGKSGTSSLPQFKEYDPFFIQVTDTRSYFGINGEDRFAIARKQLEAATQKAVEVAAGCASGRLMYGGNGMYPCTSSHDANFAAGH
jgi:hypothetical protein